MFEIVNGTLCLNINSEYINYIEDLANKLIYKLEVAHAHLNSVLMSNESRLFELDRLYDQYINPTHNTINNPTVDVQKLYKVIVILKNTPHLTNNKLKMLIIVPIAMYIYLKSKHFHSMMAYIGDTHRHNIVLDSSLYDPKCDMLRLLHKDGTCVKTITYDSINKVVDNITEFIGIKHIINDYKLQDSTIIRESLHYILDFKPPYMKIS